MIIWIFELHPDGRTAKGSLSLSQRLFDIRLTLTHDMNNLVHLSNSYINDYYNSILDELCNAVSGLNRELLAVKQIYLMLISIKIEQLGKL